jgi:ADP-heptose:LPS heptosyltransferase
MLTLDVPHFPGIVAPDIMQRMTPDSGLGTILVCPFGIKKELDMPVAVWRAIVRHLRSYGHSVCVLGDRGQRLDVANFTESETLSEHTMMYKLTALSCATLVVGVPNAWTWAATAWATKSVILYPENVGAQKWYSFISDNFGRICYPAQQLQIPVVLAGLRKLIAQL